MKLKIKTLRKTFIISLFNLNYLVNMKIVSIEGIIKSKKKKIQNAI